MTYEDIRAALDRAAATDPQLRSVMKRIREGKATFRDTAAYSQRLSALLGQVFSAEVEAMSPEERETICKALLRGNYDEIGRVFAQVQERIDEENGLHLTAVRPAYPTERVDQLAHSLLDPGVQPETIRRRAQNGAANVSQSFHDDLIAENAKIRSALGLKCYLVRETDGSCCKWCDSLAGRYVYGSHPGDIFRRHDNCGCTVTYENGRERQDVWSKRTWDARDPKEVMRQAREPTRFSEEEARNIEMHQLSQIHGLDFSAMPGKDSAAVADMKFINSEAFASKFRGKYENEAVENAVVSACRQIVKNRNGTYYEEAFFIDAHSGETFSYVKGKQKNGVKMPATLKKRLTNAPENSIIMIHNHPNSSPLSTDDYRTSTKYAALHEVIACCHNGDVYVFRNTFGTEGSIIKYPDGREECESVRDFRVAFTKNQVRLLQEDFEARHNAWLSTSILRGFFYEKR